MAEYLYDVVLHTQLGNRHGRIRLLQAGSQLTGQLTILGKTHPVEGEIQANGDCVLHGKFATPISTICYEATGHFDVREIDLLLVGQRKAFHLTGIASAGEAIS